MAGSGRRGTKHDNERFQTTSSQKPNLYRNERDPKDVQVCDCMVK